MKPKIYSYYESIPTRRQDEEFSRANAWRESWIKHGWEPIMLNNSHAKCSPLFQKLVGKILRISPDLKLEIQNNLQATIIRFVRWCALHAAGGGWMSEYDLINSGFTENDAENLTKKTLVLIGGEKSYLMYATQDMCRTSIASFISEEIIFEKKIRSEFDILNCSNSLADVVQKLVHIDFEIGKSKAEAMHSLIK